MYSSNMYKGIGVYGIIIKRFYVFEIIVFDFLNVFFLLNFLVK